MIIIRIVSLNYCSHNIVLRLNYCISFFIISIAYIGSLSF